MNLIPKANGGRVVNGMLAIAVGLAVSTAHFVPAFAGTVLTPVAFGEQERIQAHEHLATMPAMALVQAQAPTQAPSRYQTVRPEQQRKKPWYKNKHWWKKNAPIIGGAGGGALIGGLAGGGTGAVIGGAAGGGGGYLYKRLKNSHHHHHQ